MKILIVSSLPAHYSCGVKTHIEHLIRALERMAIDHACVHLSEYKTMDKTRALRNLIDFNAIGLFNLWAQSHKVHLMKRMISMQLETDRFSLIHAHDVFAAYAAWSVAASSVPILFTMHGPISYEMIAMGEKENTLRLRQVRRLEEIVYNKVCACIAVDTGQKNILVEEYGVPESKIHTVYNAIDVEDVQAMATYLPSHELPHSFFLVPRRLVAKNGVEYAIRALALAQNSHELVVAGTGPQSSFLRIIAEKCGVAERTHFVGDLSPSQLLPAMARAQGVVIPSVPVAGVIEATSLAALEAMALRRPLVASRLGGLQEMLHSDKNAFLVEPGDAQTIADALDSIAASRPDELAKKTQRCYEILMSRHSLPVWSQTMLQIYQYYI